MAGGLHKCPASDRKLEMQLSVLKHLYVLWLSLAMLAPPALAEDTAYKKVDLPFGISIEIPGHWTVLSKDMRANLAASSEARQKNAGIEIAVTYKNLLAVDAMPKPAGASIRVGVTTPLQFTQSDLSQMGPNDLRTVEQIMLNRYQKEGASSGTTFKMQAVRVEQFNDKYRALVIRYEQYGANGGSHWLVTQYKIPVEGRLLEMSFLCRPSDAGLWLPILERVKRSTRLG